MFTFGRCCCAQRDVGDEQVFGNSPLEVNTGELAPALPAERKTLHVPPDFSIRSVDSAASSGSGYVSLNEEQKAREMTKLQHMIRDFVMEFLQGVFLDAVLEDGSLVPCRCLMDSKLSVLMLQVHNTTRTIDLTHIQEICSGKELRDLRVSTPLDDLCVTLVMSDDQCVSFKFSDVQGREHFATCMKVLRLALD
uniref:ISP3 C-terminal domain-containing protein n=1 Tax=Alexandrium andersonii TaxID=327968 RepID=A0A7S2HT44_9DINO|mmetsp:Transcript_7470/g.17019  ORF Transcript_7470/g.17019 Transcript_7470/m.17019 type:complete len:194 (+) Transcript_7470:70-651(+)